MILIYYVMHSRSLRPKIIEKIALLQRMQVCYNNYVNICALANLCQIASRWFFYNIANFFSWLSINFSKKSGEENFQECMPHTFPDHNYISAHNIKIQCQSVKNAEKVQLYEYFVRAQLWIKLVYWLHIH